MSTNDEDGPSKQMSIEDLAREANKSFWGASQEHEEAEEMRMTPPPTTVVGGAGGEEDPDYEGDDDDYDGTSEGGEEGNTTTDGGERTDGGSGNPATIQKKKKDIKDRKTQVLSNVCDEFTEVTEGGQPIAPASIACGYGMQLGCIVRESMSINTKYIQSNQALVKNLLKKLQKRYTFPDKFRNLERKNSVNKLALTKMSNALSSW